MLVHKSFLRDQWAERVAQFLPGVKVSYVQGDTFDTSGDVVIAMIQTLLSRKYAPTCFEDVGLVSIDESHHVAAAAFSQSMFAQNARYTLGLSATPNRKDGLSRVVNWFVGPTAFFLQRTEQATTVVHIVKYACPDFDQPPPVNRRGDICFPTMISKLVDNHDRSAVIARHVARLALSHDVLVLSHRRQHVFDLAKLVADTGTDVGTYVGGDKQAPNTRVIVATYALTSEGFDMPRLTALVLATPASDVEQSCGRVMRGSSGAGAVIVDVVDQWGVCYAQSAKRRGFYKRSGFTCSDGDINGDRNDNPQGGTAPAAFAFLADE